MVLPLCYQWNSFTLVSSIYMEQFTAAEIRVLRQSRNKQQKDIARSLRISNQRYSKSENDPKRSPQRTTEILKALGYTEKNASEFLDAIPPE